MHFDKFNDKLLLINVPPIQDVIPLNSGIAYLKSYLDINKINNTLLNLNKEYMNNIFNNNVFLAQYDKYDEYEKCLHSEYKILKSIINKNISLFESHDVLCFSIFEFACFKTFEKIYDILDELNLLKDKRLILGGNHFLHFNNKVKCSSWESKDLVICDKLGEVFFGEVYDLEPFKMYSLPQYCDEINCDLSKVPMIYFSRGCINRCKFCPHCKINDYKIYFRDIQDIIYEIIMLKRDFGFKHFWLDTDNISNSIKHLHDFARKLILYSVGRISWRANFSLQTHYNEPINYKLLKDSGCDILLFGLESFSQKVRNDMNKPHYTNEDIFELAENCKNHDIKLIVNIISGFITETDDDFKESLKIFYEFCEKYKDILIFVTLNTYYIFSEDSYCDYEVEFDENGYWYYKENDKEKRDYRFHQYNEVLKKHDIKNKFSDKEMEII